MYVYMYLAGIYCHQFQKMRLSNSWTRRDEERKVCDGTPPRHPSQFSAEHGEVINPLHP